MPVDASASSAAHCFVPYPAPTLTAISSGPLSGLRFAVKDIFDVAGYPTGCGNPHMLALSGVKTASAPSVVALAQAGATFVGKTYTDELAKQANLNDALRTSEARLEALIGMNIEDALTQINARK